MIIYPSFSYYRTRGNKITGNDIKKKNLRITKAFKQYFPSEDKFIDISINNRNYKVEFKYKGKDASKDNKDRSHLLKLKDAMDELGLEPGDSVKFEKTGDYKFKLSRIPRSKEV